MEGVLQAAQAGLSLTLKWLNILQVRQVAHHPKPEFERQELALEEIGSPLSTGDRAPSTFT